MLPSRRRLRTKEVGEIIKRGANARGVFVTAKAVRSDTIGIRAASVVSKKTAKDAVERNRLRRALYRAIETVEQSKDTPSRGMNIVFFIRTIPPDPLAPTFAKDVATILKSLATNV